MVDVSEYGDIIINAYLDEWGRRRINSLLEDGTKTTVISMGGQVFEISVDAVVEALSASAYQTTYGVFKDAGVASRGLHALETAFTLPLSAVVEAISPSTLESTLNISPTATVKAQAETVIAKEGELKVTRLFLIIGDLAIQIQGG